MRTALWIPLALLAVACEPEIEVIEVPKSADTAPPTGGSSGTPGPAGTSTDAPPSSMGQLPPGALGDTTALDIEVTLPEGWREVEPSQMVRRAFAAGEDVQVTVTSFPGDVGGLEANVARWRQQAGLPPATQAGALGEQRFDITVADRPATLVDLTGETQRLVVVMIEVDGASWFIKMFGPNDAVVAELDKFRPFLQSISFVPAS